MDRKGYQNKSYLRHHKAYAHGPCMKCLVFSFTCPERRHYEMKRHKEIKHNIGDIKHYTRKEEQRFNAGIVTRFMLEKRKQ